MVSLHHEFEESTQYISKFRKHAGCVVVCVYLYMTIEIFKETWMNGNHKYVHLI